MLYSALVLHRTLCKSMSVTLRDSLLAVLVALLWGLNFVAIDIGLHAGGQNFPPLLFVAMRFVLVVVPWIFFVRKPECPGRPSSASGFS